MAVGVILHSMQGSAKRQERIDFFSHTAQRIVYPVQWPINTFANWLGDFASGIWNAAGLRRQVRDLQAKAVENDQLKRQILALQNSNERLRAQLTMPKIPGRRKVLADVVGFWPESQRIMLNVGTAQSVRAGDPVISPEGLVGQVVEVAGSNCYVNLATNSDFGVGGRVATSRTQAVGVVHGQGEQMLLLEIYYEDAVVNQNDLICTSGVSDVYPEGIRIGIVTTVWKDRDFGIRKALLLPFLNVNKLREVTVLAK